MVAAVGAGPAKRGAGAAFFAFLPWSEGGQKLDQGVLKKEAFGWDRGLTRGFTEKGFGFCAVSVFLL